MSRSSQVVAMASSHAEGPLSRMDHWESFPAWRRGIFHLLSFFYGRIRPRFQYGDKELAYFWSRYNLTWRGERAVEIPIVRDLLASHPGRTLEVGNVLSHFFPVNHDVLDKYEPAPGVINQDILDFRPATPYGLIVSISTLEHVGWDETPRQPEKVLGVFDHIKAHCLAPGGRFVATFPVGYNPSLDRALDEGRLPLDEVRCLKRLAKFNQWVEAPWAEVKGARFNDPFPFANGLVIATVRRP